MRGHHSLVMGLCARIGEAIQELRPSLGCPRSIKIFSEEHGRASKRLSTLHPKRNTDALLNPDREAADGEYGLARFSIRTEFRRLPIAMQILQPESVE